MATFTLAINALKAKLGQRQFSNATKKIVEDAKKVDKQMKALKGAFKGAFAFGAFLVGFRALNSAMGKMIYAAVEQEDAIAQLRVGLESTNSVSGQTVQSIRDISKQMQQLTRFSNEAIEQIAGIALSFTNITGETFPRFLSISADVATRMGTELKGTAVQLAKALNDPVANLGLLSRAGIQFTKDQKALVKELWETNRVMEAQDVVLKELERQYAGSAAAAKNTLGGTLDGLRNEFDDLNKVMGEILSPTLKEVAKELTFVVVGLTELIKKSTGLDDLKKWNDLWSNLWGIGLSADRQAALRNTGKGGGQRPAPQVDPQATAPKSSTPKMPTDFLDIQRDALIDLTDSYRLQRVQLGMTAEEAERYGAALEVNERFTRLVDDAVKKYNLSLEGEEALIAELLPTKELVNEEIAKEIRLLQEAKKKQADYQKQLDKYNEIKGVIDSVGSSFKSMFADVIVDSKDAGQALNDFIKILARMAIERGLSGLFSGITPTAPVSPTASGGGVQPLARGGIVSTPSLIAEKRRPEAVMPLKRGENGDLGVQVQGAAGGGDIYNINVDTIDSKSFIDRVTQARVLQSIRGATRQQNIRRS